MSGVFTFFIYLSDRAQLQIWCLQLLKTKHKKLGITPKPLRYGYSFSAVLPQKGT